MSAWEDFQRNLNSLRRQPYQGISEQQVQNAMQFPIGKDVVDMGKVNTFGALDSLAARSTAALGGYDPKSIIGGTKRMRCRKLQVVPILQKPKVESIFSFVLSESSSFFLKNSISIPILEIGMNIPANMKKPKKINRSR